MFGRPGAWRLTALASPAHRPVGNADRTRSSGGLNASSWDAGSSALPLDSALKLNHPRDGSPESASRLVSSPRWGASPCFTSPSEPEAPRLLQHCNGPSAPCKQCDPLLPCRVLRVAPEHTSRPWTGSCWAVSKKQVDVGSSRGWNVPSSVRNGVTTLSF